MPIATTAEHRAVADAIQSWAAAAQPATTARAGETAPDAWRKHWTDLAELGLFAAAVPEASGGAGGSVLDAAVLLEAAATALIPGPTLPTVLAGLVLGRAGVAVETTTRIATGELACGAALDTAPLTFEPDGTGELLVSGRVHGVLGADAHTGVLLGALDGATERWFVVPPDAAGLSIVERAPADFSRGLADVELDRVRVAPAQIAELAPDTVRDLAATLAAAEAAGVAAWCLRTAVDYAKVREQFGRPIGSFQAIKHLCAEMLCRVEVASGLAWDAASAADDRTDPTQAPVAAAAAAAVTLDAATETAKDCIQILGGIGFTWEHDAHLYLRRALALRQLLGTGAPWQRRSARLALAGLRRHLHIDLGAIGADETELRSEVRKQATRIAALDPAGRRVALADAGLLVPHWPAPYGRGASAAEQLVIDEELHRAAIVRPDLVIGGWAAPTILEHGSPEQIERFVPATLRGEIVWCQLFSEPGAGSDLASLRTRAQRVEGGWRLTGQKVWTSVAREADWGIALARTDADAPKHKGISYFLVDMRSAGIDIRPLREITGEALFNEVFLDDVFVPDELVVGQVNDGWRLARTTLVNERIAMGGGSSLGDNVEGLLTLASADTDHAELDRIGALVATGLACSVLDVRAALRRLAGSDPGAAASVRKLVGVRHRQAVAETALDLVGVAGAVDGDQVHAFLQTRCLTIAGGTTQVLLSLAAERLLGLPRG